MSTAYETDVVAWANEQAALLRAGKFSALDIEHIADEVEDVGKSEKRELASRMAVLLAHLLKWRFQPERQGRSWRRTIDGQRRAIAIHLKNVPGLKPSFADAEWWQVVWTDAATKAFDDAGLQEIPEACPWSPDQILDPDFLPG
ncbi:MAG TPA: DUF29 domain-containing protein [Caulobacteraceae bacterium]|nr:DUF29 domain-containing protein [Caulobacteraceae bacterium]